MNVIQATRETLLQPLQAVSGIIERRHTLPILSNVLIGSEQGESLSFVATDIEIEISARTQVANATVGAGVTVGARKLLDILRSLPEASDVTLSVQDKRLQVKSGKSRFNLQTLPAADFPRIAAIEAGGVTLQLPQKVLKERLALVHYAMAQQDIRYYLNGLLMVVEGSELKLVATDGHRLAVVSCPLSAKVDSPQEVILPRKTIMELSKLLDDSETPVEFRLSANQARFTLGDVLLVSKLVDGKFPDYTRVIPQNHPKHIRIGREVLAQALLRTAILSTEKFRGVRWVLSDGSLRVSCTNTEQEEAQEELDVDYKGDSLDIGFNVNYLLDVLNNLDSTEVDCALGDASSSALITVPGRDDFKYVVMPMRI